MQRLGAASNSFMKLRASFTPFLKRLVIHRISLELFGVSLRPIHDPTDFRTLYINRTTEVRRRRKCCWHAGTGNWSAVGEGVPAKPPQGTPSEFCSQRWLTRNTTEAMRIDYRIVLGIKRYASNAPKVGVDRVALARADTHGLAKNEVANIVRQSDMLIWHQEREQGDLSAWVRRPGLPWRVSIVCRQYFEHFGHSIYGR